MNINHLTNDINDLCLEVCQEYLKLIIPENWKNNLLEKFRNQSKESFEYKLIFKEAYKSLKEKGIENYSIDNMDITLINAIMNAKEICPTTFEMRNTMFFITKDKNRYKSHNANDKTPNELFSRAMYVLNNLRILVNESFNEEKTYEKINFDLNNYAIFKDKYNKKIAYQENKIIQEFTVEIGYQNLIKEIKYFKVNPEEINSKFKSIYNSVLDLTKNKHDSTLLELTKNGSMLDIPNAYWLYLETLLNNDNFDLTDIDSIRTASSILVKLLNSNLDDSFAIFYGNLFFNKIGIENFNSEKNLVNEFNNKGYSVLISNNKIYITGK